MTQHGDTAGPEQAAPPPSGGLETPAAPSPYLGAGEVIPQAYLAPPQPGKPGYGTAPPLRPGQRPFRPAGQSGPGQPGSGSPGYGQPGYARPGNGRVGFGQAARRRDPALAAPWERMVASLLDWTIILGASIAIFLQPLISLLRQMQAIVTQYQGQNSAAQAAIDNLSRNPSTLNTFLHIWLAAFGIALAYYWIAHAAWGMTLGKRAVGLRVVTVGDHGGLSVKTAGIRTVTFLIGPAAFLLLQSPLNFLGGALWLADAVVALTDPRVRCLHDRLAGTVVVRKRWLDQQARMSAGW
jgi:uncharacterized RDD family membrane protein YckC